MRRMVISLTLIVVFSVSVLFTVGATKPPRESARRTMKSNAVAKYGNADAISENELKIYDYFLASDQLEGRNLPSRGYDTAALYVASHLAEWGLKPGGSTSGTNGPLQPYFMPFALVTRQVVQEESKASVTGPPPFRGGGPTELHTTDFEYGKDWTVGPGGAGLRGMPPADSFDVAGNLVFAGNGYVLNKSNVNPYEGLDVRGKIIVVAGLPRELAAQQAAGRGAAAAPNPLGEDCTDYLTPEEYAAKNGAVAVVRIADFQQLAAMANPSGGRAPSLNGPFFQVTKFEEQPACPNAPSIIAGAEMTDGLFTGEKMNAAAVFYAAGANAKQDSFELTADKKLSVQVVIHSEEGHGENVVGILEGADPC